MSKSNKARLLRKAAEIASEPAIMARAIYLAKEAAQDLKPQIIYQHEAAVTKAIDKLGSKAEKAAQYVGFKDGLVDIFTWVSDESDVILMRMEFTTVPELHPEKVEFITWLKSITAPGEPEVVTALARMPVLFVEAN